LQRRESAFRLQALCPMTRRESKEKKDRMKREGKEKKLAQKKQGRKRSVLGKKLKPCPCPD